ncbi:MAG: stage II sporulation protein R [Clostridia bacterium]|jgi:stage II sporulation protein R|nr:stage II sporulation protein R [Clostridiaceae bacterium]
MNKTVYVFAIILLTVCLLVTALDIYSKHVVQALSENIVRLHVIANSNDPKDQFLKLKVRDSILTYLKQYTEGYPLEEQDLGKAKEFIQSHLDEINRIAQETVYDCGYEYMTRASYGVYYFPMKQYENFVLPSGQYSALRVEIGQSCGENWWCVLYPPLCFSEGTLGIFEKDRMELFVQSLSDENAKVVFLDSTGEPTIRFKIVEFFQSIKKRMKLQ